MSLDKRLNEAVQPVTTTSATCPSGEGMRASSSQTTSPPQVMSPNMEQNHPQESTPAKDPPPEDTSFRPKKRERTEEDLTPKSEQGQFEVKEGPGEDAPPIRSSDPPQYVHYQDAGSGPSEVSWIGAMSEPRSTQHDLEMPRSRMAGVEALHNLRERREGHEGLSTRVSNVEECITTHHVREDMLHIIFIEERIGTSGS